MAVQILVHRTPELVYILYDSRKQVLEIYKEMRHKFKKLTSKKVDSEAALDEVTKVKSELLEKGYVVEDELITSHKCFIILSK